MRSSMSVITSVLLFSVLASATNLEICIEENCDTTYTGPRTFDRTLGMVTLGPGQYSHAYVSKSTGYDLHYDGRANGPYAVVVYDADGYATFLQASNCLWLFNTTGSIFDGGNGGCPYYRAPTLGQSQKFTIRKLGSDAIHVINFNYNNQTIVINSTHYWTVDYGLAAGKGYVAAVVVLVVFLGFLLFLKECVCRGFGRKAGKGEFPDEAHGNEDAGNKGDD